MTLGIHQRDVHRRDVLATVGAAAIGGLAGCGDSAETDDLQNGSFEDGLAGWTVRSDRPMDPNKPGEEPVEADAGVTDRLASDGEQALALSIDGRQDDGTVWVQQPVHLAGVDELALDGYSESESFNTIAKVAVYTGPAPAGTLTESDFDTSAASEGHEGWKTYTYDVAHDGEGLLAVGISVVWETRIVRILDDVRLR